jgi:putative oxidoreductase
MKRNLIIEIISSLLILLFVYTALSKLLDYTSFKNVLSKSPLIDGKAAIVALALPITVSLISVFLIFPERIRICGFKGSFETMAISPYAWRTAFFTPDPSLLM